MRKNEKSCNSSFLKKRSQTGLWLVGGFFSFFCFFKSSVDFTVAKVANST